MFEGLRAYIARMLPSPRVRSSSQGAPRVPVKRIVVLGRHPNPTSDYYFAARLSAPGMPEHMFVDIRSGKLKTVDPDGAFIIVCRYASVAALTWIERESPRLAGVGLFLDDDIPAVIVGQDADLPYRLFLFFRALMPLCRLNRHLDVVWTSTSRLARQLADVHALVLPPAPPEALWNISKTDILRSSDSSVLIAYHATAVHVEEHRFLAPVMREVLAKRPNAHFEVFASAAAAGLWRPIERVTIRRPVAWADYLAESSKRKIDIMLVPLSPSSVNDCRSPTKRIDVVRAGAAGVFSISHAYGEPTNDGEILLPYDHEAWVSAILTLVDDPAQRTVSMNATRRRVADMSQLALDGIPWLKGSANQ